MPSRQLTDESVYTELCQKGFCILPSYLSEQQVQVFRSAVRRLHPAWSDFPSSKLPPSGQLPAENSFPSRSTIFPFQESCFNQAIVDPNTIALAQRWLGTEEICMRGSSCSVRYPGFVDGTGQHLDGFSLLPTRSANRSHHQLKFWYYLSDVDVDMAPTSFWPTQWTNEGPQVIGDEHKVTGPAGSLIVFCISTFHSRNHFTQTSGERYVFTVRWGRRDHSWEGQSDYVMAGNTTVFTDFIGSLSPKHRELFHFPPVGHPYYTKQTLRDLENQYPGWNKTDEYHRNLDHF